VPKMDYFTSTSPYVQVSTHKRGAKQVNEHCQALSGWASSSVAFTANTTLAVISLVQMCHRQCDHVVLGVQACCMASWLQPPCPADACPCCCCRQRWRLRHGTPIGAKPSSCPSWCDCLLQAAFHRLVPFDWAAPKLEMATVRGADPECASCQPCAHDVCPRLSNDGLTHAQVPKYQKLTAVLYDEDYGGDDEVSQFCCISKLPFDSILHRCGCSPALERRPLQLLYVGAALLCHRFGTGFLDTPLSSLSRRCMSCHSS
jgi:hypothetical protein